MTRTQLLKFWQNQIQDRNPKLLPMFNKKMKELNGGVLSFADFIEWCKRNTPKMIYVPVDDIDFSVVNNLLWRDFTPTNSLEEFVVVLKQCKNVSYKLQDELNKLIRYPRSADILYTANKLMLMLLDTRSLVDDKTLMETQYIIFNYIQKLNKLNMEARVRRSG